MPGLWTSYVANPVFLELPETVVSPDIGGGDSAFGNASTAVVSTLALRLV
jgi:hypothetical protein